MASFRTIAAILHQRTLNWVPRKAKRSCMLCHRIGMQGRWEEARMATSTLGRTPSNLLPCQASSHCSQEQAAGIHVRSWIGRRHDKTAWTAAPGRSLLHRRLHRRQLGLKKRDQQKVQALHNEGEPSWGHSFGASDGYGPYPWEQNGSGGEESEPGEDWVREPIITLLTSQGVVQLGGERVPARRAEAWQRRQSGQLGRLRPFREESYMDPHQQLCLGATFDIHATNGLDLGRRLTVLGFCRSVAMLSDVVEDCVVDQGGQVVHAELGNPSGLHERLVMTVHVPMLWGVPPQLDSLRHAIRSGGGIVEKMYRQWMFR
ncbi:hypothetical protein KFL_003020100 [Klebsormidium nitens]|uniref:DUF7811 domain-containing protein n=1 Tax=Klebsormidium nitens TaxID=105231 RepID=A0A0U9HKC8_KLENI|nr:hypothetical protein KFL_003020100 [Klebsormidium nitens]|eukprot:GAQ86650.1 hypothetical protein KFL_003020100 [Klebsormidium nitens]